MDEPNVCCEQMRAQIEHTCSEHPQVGQCPDQLVGYSARFDEYGIWVRTGEDARAYGWLEIAFCPWCGSTLPASRREQWFDRLRGLHLEPEQAPAEMEHYGWWQQP